MKKISLMAMFLLLVCSICTASFSPSKMKIGDVDGQWTYIGRYCADNCTTLKEWVMFAQPYNEQAEKMGVMDVYFYHAHKTGINLYSTGINEEGAGCLKYLVEKTGEKYQRGYNCILKLVKLDKKGNPLRKPGLEGSTMLLSFVGYPGPQGFFRCKIMHYRVYDALTHQLISDVNAKDNLKLEEILNRGVQDYTTQYEQAMYKKYGKDVYRDKINSNMYWKAASMSNCPVTPYVREDEG